MRKNIVITGGSDGLGKTLTEQFSKENNVIILATNEEKLKNVAYDNNCTYKVCDVSNYSLVEKCINEILNEFQKIDVLINNAGLWIQEELEENDSDRIKSVIEVNLLGVINTSKAVISSMKENKNGLIININSQAGINHKAEGIRVTDVMPGMMKTDMFNKLNITKNMANGLDTKEVARLIQFIIDTPSDVMIPEVGIKNINN